MTWRSAALVFFLFALAVAARPALAQPSTTSVAMQVYDDGTVSVSQSMTVPANYTSVNVLLLSSLIANPVVVDQNGSSLYFQITGENMTVYTIGATGVTVSYDTAALTSKQGTVWTLSFQAYYNTTVTLPEDATLTDVSGTPVSIGTAQGAPVVVVAPGSWTMAYGVPIQVSSTSGGTGSSTRSTTSTSSTVGLGSTSSSSTASSLSSSTTTSTPSSSSNSSSSSSSSQNSSSEATGNGTTVGVVAGVVVLAVGGGYLLVRRRGQRVDLQTPELRPDDIKVIEFLQEKGGKVLEPEIRMRFALPKTSAWRQIKRLERLGYVKVTKIGSQNQVELVKKSAGP